jgi:hypothetical protein
MSADAEIPRRLERAFRSLHIRKDISPSDIDLIILPNVQVLAALGGPSSPKPPSIFVEAHILTTESERKLIAKLARELVVELEAMHAATFRMLAEKGLMKSDIDRIIIQLSRLSDASAKGSTKSESTVPKLGRHRNLKHHGVRAIINKMYFDLTGVRPHRGKMFTELCSTVAEILKLDVSYTSFARQAYDDDRLRREPPTRSE